MRDALWIGPDGPHHLVVIRRVGPTSDEGGYVAFYIVFQPKETQT